MKNPDRQIAVFGGAFNPPTVAHQAIMQACLDQPEMDEVWVMPSGDRLDKSFGVSDATRVAMLEVVKAEVFADDSRLHISNFELTLPRPSQTYRTVGALALQHPNAQFWFAYGSDSYNSMHLWERGLELQASQSFLLLSRDASELPAENERIRHLVLDGGMSPMSSTEVRSATSRGLPIDHMVCQSVHRHIVDNQLYLD